MRSCILIFYSTHTCALSWFRCTSPSLSRYKPYQDHSLRLVLSLAAEAFTEFWRLTVAPLSVPHTGWPKGVVHALRSVGLLFLQLPPLLLPLTSICRLVHQCPPHIVFLPLCSIMKDYLVSLLPQGLERSPSYLLHLFLPH